jgi:tellurite resistance-related uncharacterized protein
VQRPITGFRTDEHGDWVALLSCGHPQHVRHRPPFEERPWVTTEDGRRGMLGQTLDCVRCDAFELPADFVTYGEPPVFTEATMPDPLRTNHTTRAGVWAKIVVLEGRLRYRVDALDVTRELSPGEAGVVLPEVAHRVEPLGAVQFRVEFYRAP